jgi:two-component system cell cycle sensor histidine kinase/response regulator CckA
MISNHEPAGKTEKDLKATYDEFMLGSESAGAAPGHDTQIVRAEMRTELAEARTELARTRTEEAEVRTEQAETRTEQAKTRTEQAETRTEQAEARSEQAIHASEVRYRRLFETAQDGILILDAESGQVMDANPFMKQLLGYSQEEFLGKKLWEIGPFKGEAASKITFAELQHQDRLRYEGLPLETKEGKRVEVEFISNAYVEERHRRIQCNIRDLTERRHVKESLNLFQLLVDRSNDGIFVIDPETGRFLDANERTCERLGYSRDELLSMTVPDIDSGVTPATRAKFVEDIRQSGSRILETQHRRKDGSTFPVEISVQYVKLDREYLIATARDITSRRKLEEQFRQSQKMDAIGQLAGGVAHDFNNILAVIQIQASLLNTGGKLTAEQQKHTEDIVTAVQRAAALTRQLLMFSRKEIIRRHDLDLSQSINNMTQMLRRILGEDIQTQFKFSMESLVVHADAGMMDQVLMNLAVNSRDAMPDGGQLIITTSAVEFDELAALQTAQARQGSFVCLSVSYTGCGISPENLSRIFEPFFTTKEVGKGTGLGLATVFGIVQQHQGWINVYSEGGHGTTFRIYLPRLLKVCDQKSDAPAPALVRGGDETILLVEDDYFLRESIGKALSQLGYCVLEAANGVKALEIWEQNHDKIQLLLTDMVMPGGINGKNLGEQLLQKNPRLKVIYASGYSAEVAGKDFPLEEGVNFLIKPFEAQKLAQTIRACLEAKSGVN